MIASILDWIGRNKLLSAGIATGVYLLLRPGQAKASPAPVDPKLPGTNAIQLPGGSIQWGGVLIPPPQTINTTKTVAKITTRDPAPMGNLLARANNSFPPTSSIMGYWPKDGLVEILSPGTGNGMIFLRGPGVGPNGPTVLEGWAHSQYLTKIVEGVRVDPTTPTQVRAQVSVNPLDPAFGRA